MGICNESQEVPVSELLGCTSQACKACACPASRLKKEPRVSNTDINGLMGWGAYTSEARSWSNTPLCAERSEQDTAAIFAPGFAEAEGGEGRLPLIGELTSGGLISYQRNQWRGTPLTAPLIRTITSWGLELVHGKVSQVSRV